MIYTELLVTSYAHTTELSVDPVALITLFYYERFHKIDSTFKKLQNASGWSKKTELDAINILIILLPDFINCKSPFT